VFQPGKCQKGVNAQKVWVMEADNKGFWTDLHQGCNCLQKRGSDLALQCLVVTGQYTEQIIAYTSAPEDFDFGAETLAWLPYQDVNGKQYRQICLKVQEPLCVICPVCHCCPYGSSKRPLENHQVQSDW